MCLSLTTIIHKSKGHTNSKMQYIVLGARTAQKVRNYCSTTVSSFEKKSQIDWLAEGRDKMKRVFLEFLSIRSEPLFFSARFCERLSPIPVPYFFSLVEKKG